MHRIAGAVPVVFFCLAGIGVASPKVAVVRVADIYRQLDSTVALTAEVRQARDAVEHDPRRNAFDGAKAEHEALFQRLLKAAESSEAERQRIEREYMTKTQELMTLQREFMGFRDRRLKEINSRMVEQMEATLAHIRETAAEVGKREGYDWVLDLTGQTNTGLPFVLYAKNPPDITESVVVALAAAAPEMEMETAAGTPPQ